MVDEVKDNTGNAPDAKNENASKDAGPTRAELDLASGHVADLQGKIATILPVLTELGFTADENGSADSPVDQLIAAARSLHAGNGELTTARDQALADLATAKQQASVHKGPRPPKLRDAGALGTKHELAIEDVNARCDALIELVKAGPLTIVFSDGKREIDVLDPLTVSGEAAWQRVPGGLMLRAPVLIKPDRPITLAGFGLFDAKGKQVGWSPMMMPTNVAAGVEMKLDRQIVF